MMRRPQRSKRTYTLFPYTTLSRSAGQRNVWLPYTQMKTAGAHLPVVSASGSRLKLADGRELVDGIASWWTAAHGYRHPHIEAAVERQLKTLPHVMLGGLAHEQAYRLATRLAALLPDDLDPLGRAACRERVCEYA